MRERGLAKGGKFFLSWAFILAFYLHETHT